MRQPMDYAKQAQETLKDHVYTLVAQTDGLEVWKCRQPGHGRHNALDILITQSGMCVMGDYCPVVFRVGAEYGLPFMARKVDAYYFQKLEPLHDKEKVYTEERGDELLKWECRTWLENNNVPFEGDAEIAMRDYAEKLENLTAMDDEQSRQYEELLELISFANDVPGYEQAHEFYNGLRELSFFSGDYPNVEVYSDNLIYRLHLAQTAARAILAQQQPQPGDKVDVVA